MKKELAVAFLALGMILSIGSAAADKTQDSTVDVNVSKVTQLDVRPSTLSYGTGDSADLEPGNDLEVSDNGYGALEISNIGSEEIAEVTAEATMPSNQSFGREGISSVGTGEQHDTGNFVTVSTETADDAQYNIPTGALAEIPNMTYLNRAEFVEESPPTYIQTNDASDSIDPDSFTTEEPEVGRFRVGGAEYFFVYYSSGSGDWTLRIGETPHTSTQLGTVDFTNEGTDYVSYTDGDTDVTSVSEGGFRVDGHEFVSFDEGDSSFTGQSLLDGDTANATAVSAVAGTEVRNYNLFLNFAEEELSEHHIVRTSVNTNVNNPVSDNDYGATTSGAQVPIFSTGTEDEQGGERQSFTIDIGV